jgi:CheY-like chemotaxis protein
VNHSVNHSATTEDGGGAGIFSEYSPGVVHLPVLLVDDDLSLAQTMTSAIQAAGLPVEHCTTGEVAIELLKVKRYSVVIVDLILPSGISGVYVVNALRRRPAAERPAVLMITAGSAENLRGVDRQLVAAVLFKPLDIPLFREFVLAAHGHVAAHYVDGMEREDGAARTFCGNCQSEIPPWVADSRVVSNLVDPDETFSAWLDTPCRTCGNSPRASGGRSAWAAGHS